MRTEIKQDLSTDLDPLDYAIWGVLENKTNATSHQNIGSLETAIEEERNKMCEEFFEGKQIVSNVCCINNFKNGHHFE